MTAGIRQQFNRPAGSLAYADKFALSRARPSHWLALMAMFVTITTFSLLMSETHFLIGNPIANAVRFGSLSLLAVMIAFRPRNRFALRKPKLLDGFALTFCALAFSSMLYSADPSLTVLRAASATLLYAAVFWTLWFYADVGGGQKIASILVGCVAVIFVAGIFNLLMAGPDAMLSGRFRGLLANPNAVGMLTILFLPLVLAMVMRTKRLSGYLLIAIMLGSVVLSGSRNGVMTTSVGMAFFALRIKAWKSGILLITICAASYLAMPDYSPAPGVAAKPISHILSSDKLANGGGRLEAWQVAIPIIQNNLALGHGFGTEELIFKGMKFRIHRGEYIHNSYLGLTYQLGLAGSLMLFIPLIGLLIYRLMGHGFRSPQTAAYEAMLFGGLIAAFFESWVYSAGNAFAFPFWTCVMLLTRASMGAPDTNDPLPPPKRPTTVRSYTPMRSLSPASGPVRGLVPVASNPAGVTRPNPRRFDPPARED
ncbi:MAG: O-antigen ligase family protein [Gemmatimonadales bacterium]